MPKTRADKRIFSSRRLLNMRTLVLFLAMLLSWQFVTAQIQFSSIPVSTLRPFEQPACTEEPYLKAGDILKVICLADNQHFTISDASGFTVEQISTGKRFTLSMGKGIEPSMMNGNSLKGHDPNFANILLRCNTDRCNSTGIASRETSSMTFSKWTSDDDFSEVRHSSTFFLQDSQGGYFCIAQDRGTISILHSVRGLHTQSLIDQPLDFQTVQPLNGRQGFAVISQHLEYIDIEIWKPRPGLLEEKPKKKRKKLRQEEEWFIKHEDSCRLSGQHFQRILGFSHDSQRLLYLNSENRLVIADVGQCSIELISEETFEGIIRAVRPEGSNLIFLHGARRCILYSIDQKKIVQSIEGVSSADITPDGTHIIVASGNKVFVHDGRSLDRLREHTVIPPQGDPALVPKVAVLRDTVYYVLSTTPGIDDDSSEKMISVRIELIFKTGNLEKVTPVAWDNQGWQEIPEGFRIFREPKIKMANFKPEEMEGLITLEGIDYRAKVPCTYQLYKKRIAEGGNYLIKSLMTSINQPITFYPEDSTYIQDGNSSGPVLMEVTGIAKNELEIKGCLDNKASLLLELSYLDGGEEIDMEKIKVLEIYRRTTGGSGSSEFLHLPTEPAVKVYLENETPEGMECYVDIRGCAGDSKSYRYFFTLRHLRPKD